MGIFNCLTCGATYVGKKQLKHCLVCNPKFKRTTQKIKKKEVKEMTQREKELELLKLFERLKKNG